MIKVKQIEMSGALYQQERDLRNRILLRPIGLPDFGWEMRDKDCHHIVAIDDNKVIGCVILYPLPDNLGQAQLMQMAVESSYQRKGVGQQMLQLLFKVAIANNISEIQCHAQHTALIFYEKMGFQIEGDGFIEAGIKHFHMRYRL